MPKTISTSAEPKELSFPGTDDAYKCGAPDCVGHDVIDTHTTLGPQKTVQIPGFTSRAVRDRSPHVVVVFDKPIALTWSGERYLVLEEIAGEKLVPCRWVRRQRASRNRNSLGPGILGSTAPEAQRTQSG